MHVEFTVANINSVKFDRFSAEESQKAIAKLEGTIKAGEDSAGLAGIAYGVNVVEYRRVFGEKPETNRSAAYVSNATAVADILRTIAEGSADWATDCKTELQASKLVDWAHNIRAIYAAEHGPQHLNTLVNYCKDAFDDDGTTSSSAFCALYKQFGEVSKFKNAARIGVVSDDQGDEDSGDDQGDEDDKNPDAWIDMVRNALLVGKSHGATALDAMAIVNEVFGS